jgi:PHD and RING finger domain-containing protein 1
VQNVNTCPVDRQTFSLVLVRQGVDGVIYRRVPVENRQLNVGEEEPTEDLTFCEVCGRADHEDRLLLCDGCDLGYWE